jgi:hypothetical protein
MDFEPQLHRPICFVGFKFLIVIALVISHWIVPFVVVYMPFVKKATKSSDQLYQTLKNTPNW